MSTEFLYQGAVSTTVDGEQTVSLTRIWAVPAGPQCVWRFNAALGDWQRMSSPCPHPEQCVKPHDIPPQKEDGAMAYVPCPS